MTTAAVKSALRRQLRRARAAISSLGAQAAASSAAHFLLRSRWITHARHVAVYLDTGSELQTTPLIEALLALGKQVYVPKVHGTQLRFVRLQASTPLRRKAFGIHEPTLRRPQRSLRKMDVIVLPLVGVDARGVRLGNGGGYYDRALSFPCAYCQPRLIGYGYEQQRVASIPADVWDTRLDAVVTERGLTHFNR